MGRHRRLLIFLTIASVLPAAIWSFTARAANLQYAANYLNRQQASLSSGISHHLFLTPATNLPGAGNIIRMEFTSSPGGTWCRVAGADIGVAGVSNPPGASETATLLPGTLTANCTIGNGVTTFDTITITGINPLTSGTKYGLVLTDPGIAKLGTPPTQNSTKIQLTTNNGASDVDTLLFYTATIPSDQVVISAVVAAPPIPSNPVVHFSGLIGSNANLTITRGGSLVLTTSLGVDGTFDQTLSNQPVGEQTYVVAATDSSGRSFSSLTFILNLVLNSTTDLSNIFLGPTASVGQSSVTVGQSFTVSGTSVPLSSVALTVASIPSQTYTIITNSSGQWERLINSTDLGIGTFVTTAKATFNSLLSSLSPQLTLTVTPSGTTNTNIPTTNTNKAVNTKPPVIGPPSGFAIADLNKDNKVNLIDFSILMFYWQLRNPANLETDINKDSVVDIIDISIMLFQWTSTV